MKRWHVILFVLLGFTAPVAYSGCAVANHASSDMTTDNRFTVHSEGRFVIAHRNDEVLWKVDAVAASPGPVVGDDRVRDVSIQSDEVHAVIGKHTHVVLDLQTGRVLSAASD